MARRGNENLSCLAWVVPRLSPCSQKFPNLSPICHFRCFTLKQNKGSYGCLSRNQETGGENGEEGSVSHFVAA